MNHPDDKKPSTPTDLQQRIAVLQSRQQELELQNQELREVNRQLQVALTESRNLFELVTDSLPQLVWIKDRCGKYVYGNASYFKTLGLTGSEIIGKSDTDFYPADHALKYQTDDRAVIAGGRITQFDEKIRLNGRESIFRTTKVPLRNADNHIYSTLGIAEDITDLKLAEAQIRKLAQAVEQSPECIVITNLNAEIEFVNEAFVYATGYRREELIGKNSRMLQSGKTPPKNYQQLWDALTNGRQWQGELFNRRKDGREYIEYARIAPIRQEDGRISHYVGIKEDITEKKRNATLILESKILLQRVIDSIPDWVFVFDQVNRYMLVNQSYAQFFNLKTDLMIGMTDREIGQAMGSDDSPFKFSLNRVDDIKAVFNGELIHNHSETIRLSDSETVVFDTYWIPLFDAANSIYGALCYRRNVTSRVLAEQQQQRLAEQLHQAQKMEMVGQFTGGIAHDFNNILASIFGYAELLRDAPAVAGNPRLEKYVDQILRVGKRARDLIRNLMVFSQKDESQQQAINVSDSMQEVVESLRPTFSKDIGITLRLATNLPAVIISPVQLHQVIMNLAINARDALAGTGTLEFSVEQASLGGELLCDSCHAAIAGAYVKLVVRDSGSGIAQDVIKRIFDPFFTTKKLAGGSGLGLSVIHGIVHSASGHISVTSQPECGTEFCVYLPLAGKLPRQKESMPVAILHRSRARILVVDDEPAIVNYQKDLLEAAGYQVSAFTQAKLALLQFQSDPNAYDLLITDQEMAEFKGVDLVKALHALRADLPIIMCTGFTREIDEQLALELGIRHFLLKPIPGDVLMQAISSCLDVPDS